MLVETGPGSLELPASDWVNLQTNTHQVRTKKTLKFLPVPLFLSPGRPSHVLCSVINAFSKKSRREHRGKRALTESNRAWKFSPNGRLSLKAFAALQGRKLSTPCTSSLANIPNETKQSCPPTAPPPPPVVRRVRGSMGRLVWGDLLVY